MDLNIINYNYFSRFLIVLNYKLDTQESIECISSFCELATEVCTMLEEDLQMALETNQDQKIKSVMIVDLITKELIMYQKI